MNNACCIGHGYVGKATCLSFGIERWYTRTEGNITPEQAAQMKYIFICLPTPTIDGRVFVSDIVDVINKINQYDGPDNRMFIIRSTVYPGFAKQLMEESGMNNIVSNPEFLTESTWEQDAKQPQLVVLGSDDPKYLADIKALYMGRFKYMQPILTNTQTAELIKWTMNGFFSTTTIFVNEMYDVAQKVGANWEGVKMALMSHPWGKKNHLDAWYKGRRGIHGHCLPKDLWALAEFSKSPFFKTMMEINGRLSEIVS